ncbi:fungal-specific transcription factor domain-containing protein [Colletotrichum navitas]|uniref:Fungal-specific transcription factor domain-containing protein n=1 Tax=Colletotrichum navitas TaxID=681940 RepID=A0AAD8Q698_9PEZI|nr:fungal-specific transcription factor domain-containing protein [Colletotrichum navitas]KAK1596715.1 fungal-specific transcription factor domain-containing protein [Colletotrichum navitas]
MLFNTCRMHILKKKCDETRPQCSRCAERAQECSYEPVKPRQRKKRDSIAGFGSDTGSQTSASATIRRYSAPDATMRRWKEECLDDENDVAVEEAMLEENGNPLIFDYKKMFAMYHNKDDDDAPLFSPVDSVAFDLSLEDVDEEVIRCDSVQHNAISRLAATRPQRHSDLTMIAPVPVASPHLELLFPTFSEFSDRPNRRALVDHFTNVMSHLIVLRETETGNPFRQLVLPLCHSSSTVTNTIYALASAHLENRGCGHAEEKAVYFHNQAIQGLARLIELGGQANKNELLATIMLLVYYEVLVQQNRSNIVDGHLKGAIAIMNANSDDTDPTAAFLERAFRFYDVIAALSFGTAPLSTAPATGCLAPFPPIDSSTSSSLGSVDTLLGFSTTLWPIIHRLSNLLSLKTELQAAIADGQTTKVAVLRSEFETTSEAIEHALKVWQPSFPPGFSPDTMDDVTTDESEVATERARLQSILNNALAYRHSAFVYLYRSIYGYPRRHHLVQHHTHAALSHCAATVKHAGSMAALLWPLFVAACEAISPGDRELAQQAFVAVERRQGMTNIQRAWTIAQEVWRRADMIDDHTTDDGGAVTMSTPSQQLGKGADLWRRVSEDMGVTIVFG